MKKFLRSLWHNSFSVRIRNFFGFKPQHRKWHYVKKSFSATDAFFWRVDSNFKTIFKYSDIIGKYFEENSKLYFVFLDSQGDHILSKEFVFSRSVQTLLIDHSFLGREGYGSFFAYNIPQNPEGFDYKVTNRCYTGFIFKSNGPSFVHGNVISRYLEVDSLLRNGKSSSQSAVFDHNVKTSYHIQKDFSKFSKNEFFFFNPMSRNLAISINGIEHQIKSLCTKLVEFNGEPNQVTEISSNYNFARPIVLSYCGGYLDAHHA